MLAVRVIPCLDVRDDRVVKGVNFEGLRDVGDVAEMAARYDSEGADELVFLDINATADHRGTRFDWVRRAAERLFIPFTVGGGITCVDEVRACLRAGADKVAMNSAAVKHPDLLREVAEQFGSQCAVLACDVKRTSVAPSGWEVYVAGGRTPTGLDALEWIARGVALGAGELLVTSMDADGTEAGYDCALYTAIRGRVSVPLIASGGAGNAAHLVDAIRAGADGVLAASIFHFGELTVAAVKDSLADAGFPVRR